MGVTFFVIRSAMPPVSVPVMMNVYDDPMASVVVALDPPVPTGLLLRK
jgi:hypothetical protein